MVRPNLLFRQRPQRLSVVAPRLRVRVSRWLGAKILLGGSECEATGLCFESQAAQSPGLRRQLGGVRVRRATM